MEKYIDDSRVHEGHRSRMKAKLVAHGQRIFDTYELLEMLLYHVIPYRDTNPIAKNLLAGFGSLDGVFNATKKELASVCGIGERAADFLLTVGALSGIIGAEILDDEDDDFSDYESVGRFLAEYFSGVEQKQVVGLFLDSSMRLISMKTLYELDYESGGVKAKPFIDEALSNHASVVISAHNHPYGPFYPTQGDRATNTALTDALNIAGFVHAEHYIICGDCFAGIGSLKHFTVKLSQMPAVSDFITTRDKYDGRLHKADDSITATKRKMGAGGQNLRDADYLATLIGYSAEKSREEKAFILLSKYRTIENIFTAPIKEVSVITGEKTAIYLKLLAYITSRRRTDGFVMGKKHSSAEIAEYLKALFLGESVEKTYLIAFDKSDRVIGFELLGEGTVNASEVLPRKAIEAAINLSAASVSMAHNHPFGTTNPSSDDVNITQLFVNLFDSCEIKLKEHFIVAGQLCDTVIF